MLHDTYLLLAVPGVYFKATSLQSILQLPVKPPPMGVTTPNLELNREKVNEKDCSHPKCGVVFICPVTAALDTSPQHHHQVPCRTGRLVSFLHPPLHLPRGSKQQQQQ